MSAHLPSVLLLGDTLNFGGTEGQFVEVARGLDRTRWQVDVACIRAEGPLRPRLEAAGLRPWSCGRGSFKSPRLALAVLALARHLRAHKVDVVHSFDFYSNVLGVPAARLARVPAVIASQRDLGNLRPWHEQRVQAAMLGMARHVMVNSDAIAERLARTRAARAGRLSVIRNGVDLDRFGPAAARPSRAMNVTVGTLANLRPEKGLRELVEAAALLKGRVPGATFAIWGEGPLRSELEDHVRALGLTEVVRLNGLTREPERVLHQCDMLVLPSLSEASSNVVLEAMAAGLPVIATRVGGTPSLVSDGQTGLLVPPGDPSALAEAIWKLIQTPELAGRLAAGARQRALADFGMSRMLDRIDELYCRVLGLEGRVAIGASPVSGG